MGTIKNKIGKQFKTLQFDTKELSYNGDSRKISGYAAVFNNVDKAEDMLLKGCFAKSIADRGPMSSAKDKIIFLWQHDMHEPIGRITELKEDEHGLYFEAEVDDVERGNQALKQLQSGTLNQFSIGYNYVWEKCEWGTTADGQQAFMVGEVVLHEISVVSIGCNGETEFLGMKSTEDEEQQYRQLAEEIESVCKGLPAVQKESVQNIIRKAMSLAAIKPKHEVSLEEKQADTHIENEKYSLFKSIKLKD